MPVDYHMHTPLCQHAEGTIAEYAETARHAGLREIGISDHMPMPPEYDPSNRMRLDQFPEYIAQIREAQNTLNGMTVRFGLEGDYVPEHIDFIRNFVGQYPFDYVLGSVHFIGDWAFDNPDHMKEFDARELTDVYRDYFTLVAEMAATGLFDIVSHFDLVKKFGYYPDNGYVQLTEEALDAIQDNDLCMELNTAGLRRTCSEIFPGQEIVNEMAKRGIPITLGSDAHRPAEVGSGFEDALAMAHQAGYREICRFTRRERTAIPLNEAAG